MSDFLGRLVERSLGLAEAVLPRPVALFEAPSPSPALAAENVEEVATGEPVPAPPVHTATLDPPTLPPPAALVPLQALDTSASAIPVPAPTEGRRPAAAARQERVPAASVDATPPPPSDLPATRRDEMEPATAREPRPAPVPPPAPVVVHRMEKERLHPFPADPPPPSVIVQPTIRETRVEQVILVEKLIEKARSDAPLFRPTVRTWSEPHGVETLRPAPETRETRPAPAGSTRVERRRELADGPSRQSAAPAVHVTIGRLEVRAAALPPPPPARPRPPAAVMSLDDYLRQRASGNKP